MIGKHRIGDTLRNYVRVLFFVTACIALGAAVTVGAFLVQSRRAVATQTVARAVSTARTESAVIAEYLGNVLRSVEHILDVHDLQDAGATDFVPEIVTTVFVDAEGDVVIVAPPGAGSPDSSLVRAIVSAHTERLWGMNVTADADGSVVMSRRKEAADGSYLGAAVAVLGHARIESVLRRHEFGGAEAALIVGEDGNVLTRLRFGFRPDDEAVERRIDAVATRAGELPRIVQPGTTIDREKGVLTATSQLRGFPVHVITIAAYDEILSEWSAENRTIAISYFAIAIVFLIALALAAVQFRRFHYLESDADAARHRADVMSLLRKLDGLDRATPGLHDLAPALIRMIAEFIRADAVAYAYRPSVSPVAVRRIYPETDHADTRIAVNAFLDQTDGTVVHDSARLSELRERSISSPFADLNSALGISATGAAESAIVFVAFRRDAAGVSTGDASAVEQAIVLALEILARRRAAEISLRHEARYRLFFHGLPVGVALVVGGSDARTIRLAASNSTFRALAPHVRGIVAHAAAKNSFRTAFAGVIAGDGPLRATYRDPITERYFDTTMFAAGSGEVAVVLFDVTETVASVRRLRDAIEEREVLLREVHHRVKNNLNVVMSLLSLQAGATESESARDALEIASGRIRSIATIHHLIKDTENLARVDIAEYTENLVANVLQSVEPTGSRLLPVCDVESIRIDIDTLKTYGLIVNELATNVARHAYPDREGGHVNVTFRRIGEARARLVVKDDGVGFTDVRGFERKHGFGLSLVEALVTDLHGTITIDSGSGTTATVTFELPA